MARYKYQGFGAGPETHGELIGLRIAIVVLLVCYAGAAWLVVGHLR